MFPDYRNINKRSLTDQLKKAGWEDTGQLTKHCWEGDKHCFEKISTGKALTK